MTDALGTKNNPVLLDRDTAVDVTIDLHSKHRAHFTLYVRERPSARWEDMKGGDTDTLVTLSAARAKLGLLCEFMYWTVGGKFRAALIFDQGDGKQVVDVSAADNAAFTSTELATST